MKSKRYIYFFTIFSILYFIAFFQQGFTQDNCNRHSFEKLVGIVPPSFPTAWHFISLDTLLVFGDNKVMIYHNLRSGKPKFYLQYLTTNEWDNPKSDETERWTCNGVSFVNSRLGYAAASQYDNINPEPQIPYTYRGSIFKTTDGGLSWKRTKGDSSLLTHGFQKFEIRNNIFYALSGGNFIQSTDEGMTWTKIGSPKYINGVQYGNTFYFADDTTIIVGGYNTFGKSIDGGKTWKNTTKTDCSIRSIIFFTKERGFAVSVGTETCTYKTVDGGDTWLKTDFGLPVNQWSNLAYLYKVNDTTAYATGESMGFSCFYHEQDKEYISRAFLAKTVNAGKTWKFFYDCPRLYIDDTPGLITRNPMFVWALDQPDSSVFILEPNRIFYSQHGGEPNSIEKNEIIPAPNFRFYPNPASNQFTIESSEGIKKVSMYNPLGKRVLFKESSLERTMKLDVEDLPHGIYLLQVETDGGSVTQKVVVE